MQLSKRGTKLTEGSQPLVKAHFKCAESPWNPQTNPDGYINLGTAENHLLFDILEPILNQPPEFREEHTHYSMLHGMPAFREALAQYLSDMTGAPVLENQIVAASGSSAIIDMLMVALCDAGEGVIIPAPYYAGFDHDLKGRANVEPIPVYLNEENQYDITIEALQESLMQASKRQIKVKAILITSPNNPIGRTYPEDMLHMIIRFAKEQKLEIIADELYARSVFGDAAYISMWKLAHEEKKDIHVVYSFAKDFGLSGFKTGMLFSTNEKVLAVMRELAYFAPVSNATQQILTKLLQQEAFLDHLFSENARRLKQAWYVCHRELKQAEIPHETATAGFFAWLDLREWLETNDEAGEMKLYQKMLETGKVNLSPGLVFNSKEPGFFRLCYARPEFMIETAVKRIADVCASIEKRKKVPVINKNVPASTPTKRLNEAQRVISTKSV